MKKMITAREISKIENRNNGREAMTNMFIASEAMTAYHVSSERIEYLGLHQTICLYPEIPNQKNTKAEGNVISESFVYAVTFPKGTEVFCFGENEYRILINENTFAEQVGMMETIRLEKPERESPFRPGYINTKVIFSAI